MLSNVVRRVSSALVNRSEYIFNTWYDMMAHPVPTSLPPDSFADPVVEDIRTKGVGIIRGAFSREFANQVLTALSNEIDHSVEAFKTAPADLLRIDRPEQGIIYSQNFLDCGRQMADWIDLPNAPEPIRTFAFDPRFSNIVHRYYGMEGRAQSVSGVRLTPCPTDDSWHIDSILDKVKVMLCVSEVTRENGPMIYKLGTHDHPRPLHSWYFNSYRYGKSSAYGKKEKVYRGGSDYAELGNTEGESLYLTGEPGDCFLFDTRGVHMAAACKTGVRFVVIAGFAVETQRNRSMISLKKPGIAF